MKTLNKQTKTMQNEIKILLRIKDELDIAAKVQPCPACKEDTEKLSAFVGAKAYSIKNNSAVDKGSIKALKEVDFINELTDIAIVLSKVIRPFARVSKVPEVYERTLHDDLESNRKVRKHLLMAKRFTAGLRSDDRHFKLTSEILGSFIRATEFKLSIDPFSFYIFDRIIRIGYKTKALSAASRMIITAKTIIDPSRYG
jgi:hypothetical protein